MMEELPVTTKTVTIEPHWPGMARWYVRALADHSFERGTGPVASFMEIIRYLQQTDPAELDAIIKEAQR